jgi:GAF domain-containing protein/HAMP domain-containing protein
LNTGFIRLSLRAKLVIAFALLSTFVAGVTVRGFYTNIANLVSAEVRRQILLQSLSVLVVAVLLGIFFGYVAGSLLADPVQRLTKATTKFASGEFGSRSDIKTGDEIEKLGESFNEMAAEIEGLITNLEQRVAGRTEELANRTDQLELLTSKTQERALKLRAIAEVARSIASVQNIDQLLPAITVVVSQEFGYYHVGIFLNDDNNDFAILRAANSLGGKRMLARNHKLRIGQVGLVGSVASTGKARIALDTGADAVFFNNPELPETHSEIALPLRIGGEIIGVLDVQSEQSSAFSQEDVELLSILADQISSAIRNARLFAETTRALSESESVYRQYIRQQWSEVLKQNEISGAKYTGYEVVPIDEMTKHEGKETRTESDNLSVPIKLRDEVIGLINVRAENKPVWDEDEIDIAEAVAERVAIALENARLLQEAQRRAAKERLIGDISARISGATNVDNIMQTALAELSHLLPNSEIAIQIEPEE